jgi:DNA-binding SARP family transcriptional activator
VLGPFQLVGADGKKVAVSERARYLLAALVASRTGRVAMASLASSLGRDMENSEDHWNRAASEARKALKAGGVDHGDVVNLHAGYYGIDRAVVTSDIRRFEALVGEARRLEGAGKAEDACVRLEEALGCWRGDEAADLDAADLVAAELVTVNPGKAAGLAAERLVALELWIKAKMATGETPVAKVQELVAQRPHDEGFSRLCMLALYQSQGQVAARREYLRLVDALAVDGFEPSPETRALEERILRHDVSFRPGRPLTLRAASGGPRDRVRPLVEWLAQVVGVDEQTIIQDIHARQRHLDEPGPESLTARRSRRLRVPRKAVVEALTSYYDTEMLDDEGLRPFRFEVDGHLQELGVVTTEGWTGCHVELGTPSETCLLLSRPPAGPVSPLRQDMLAPSIERLAEAESGGQRIWDAPVYRLTNVLLDADRLEASFALDNFAHYALTLDLLENELLDALAEQGNSPQRVLEDRDGTLPLRSAYLPTAEAVRQVGSRLCAGGVATVFAHAIKDDEYLVLLQKRSHEVLNVAGRLSVVPKAFHQPLWDAQDEVSISTTVKREFEEELIGRDEIESANRFRGCYPFGLAACTPAMQALHKYPESWRIECTGLSLNLLTGNYDFSCLFVVTDSALMSRLIERGYFRTHNWEIAKTEPVHVRSDQAAELRRISLDDGWADEALFAFVHGLRRLGALAPSLTGVGL